MPLAAPALSENATLLEIGNHVSLGLLLGPDREFLGISDVRVDDVPLRNPSRPMVLRIDTPDGMIYPQLFVEQIATDAKSTVVTLKAIGMPWGRGEYYDEYEQGIVHLRPTLETVEDRVTLTFTPRSQVLNGRTFSGFSYSIRFQSDAREVHRILVDGSWEIGGAITGNTILHQGHCNMPVYHGKKETHFTTACLKTLDQYGSVQGYSYQLAPRGGLLQTFDFHYSAAGALLMYWPQFGTIASLLETPPGSDLLHALDEYRPLLGKDVTTPEKYVLFARGSLQEHEARNVWWHAYQMVNGEIRAAYGVAPTVVTPEVGINYIVRVAKDGKLKIKIADEEVDSRDVMHAMADRLFPILAKKGIRRFFPDPLHHSDVTEHGFEYKLQNGLHGDTFCSSVCASHRFLPSDFFGGMAGWKYLYSKAKALNIELGIWFGTGFSPRAAIFREHPEYHLIASNSLRFSGGYGINSQGSVDWNSGIYDWLLNDLKRWKEEGGLDYIFTDSWANLGVLPLNFKERMRSNFDPMGRLYHDFQKMGIPTFTFEGISPFGVSRFGTFDLRGDTMDAVRGIVGQNDFGWWADEIDMAHDICVLVEPRRRTEANMESIQFRAMASRSMVNFMNQYNFSTFEIPEWWVRLNHIYSQALPHMKTREMLPDRSGVCWSDGAIETVFAFRDLNWPVSSQSCVEELCGESVKKLDHTSEAKLKAGGVYRIQTR